MYFEAKKEVNRVIFPTLRTSVKHPSLIICMLKHAEITGHIIWADFLMTFIGMSLDLLLSSVEIIWGGGGAMAKWRI